jgi:PAS domain-containing protein
MALVAGGVAAVAALGVATGLAAGSGARPPVIVAGAVLLAAAAGAALLAVWRCYTQPAARSARILAEVAGDSGQPDASLEAVAAAARVRLSRLEHANQRLSAVIGGLPQGVLVFGYDGTLLEINGTGAAMLGAAPTAE